jgi:hypothetical protein
MEGGLFARDDSRGSGNANSVVLNHGLMMSRIPCMVEMALREIGSWLAF